MSVIHHKCNINSAEVCIKNLAQNAGDSIELIQTSGKFMLEISPKCWSLQPNEYKLAALTYIDTKTDHITPAYFRMQGNLDLKL